MIINTTTLRQGLLRASSSRINSLGSAATPFSTAFLRCTEPSTSRQRGHSNSLTESYLPLLSATANAAAAGQSSSWRHSVTAVPQHFHSQLVSQRHSYQTLTPTLRQSAGAATAAVNNIVVVEHQGALPKSIRSAILQDLRSVDADNNGKIGADELMSLLRKHNHTFTEAEIVELGELFYTSLAGSAVDIDRFLDAIDAAAAAAAKGIQSNDDIVPLAMKGKFKTHPLGIGTCASEYM
jgi:hypothetical protein